MKISPLSLKAFAGVIWVLVGGMLLMRSVPMVEAASEQSGWTTTIVSLVVGALLGAAVGVIVGVCVSVAAAAAVGAAVGAIVGAAVGA